MALAARSCAWLVARVTATLVAPHWRVFAQGPLDLPRLISNARTYFGLTLSILASEGRAQGDASAARIALTDAEHGLAGELLLLARDATASDHVEALAADPDRSGMGLLAARCKRVWIMTAPAGASEALLLAGAAVLASVALGPALPADSSALLGVNSARRRWDALRARLPLAR